ncbi:MAG: mechanosensitive ion channel [Dysgonamonadaceae bacterium]|nr:mechanosensitive ion channel [Dysgonamonadaceae bacterium]MDD4728988.1 mechanosensitive ion channel [Dysgonamonadaceae bacterium]
MNVFTFQIGKTIILIIVFLILRFFTKRLIKKVGLRFNYQLGRVRITNKIANALLGILLLVFLMIIWGIEQTDLVVFLSTTLTILGVAFFAQWSLISNITSTLIIFFNHPIRIGDSLTIMEKDYEIEGELSDIGIFFITIKTKENKKITMPSNIFLQKMIKKEDEI